jgi:hypothetical protein
LSKRTAEGAEFSIPFLFEQFKVLFKLDGLKLINEERSAAVDSLGSVQKQISNNILACIDQIQLNKLVTLLSQQLIPLLVNLYTLDVRVRLLEEASDSSKLRKLLRE